MEVSPIEELPSFLSDVAGGEGILFLFCYENETMKSIKESLGQSTARRVVLLVGPEGGFTPDEAEAAEAHGGISVTMGERILRAETAAVAALAVVQYEKGDLG